MAIPLLLLVMSFVFAPLISIPYYFDALLKLVSCLPPTVPTCSSNVSVMIGYKKNIEQRGDSRHPCLLLTLVLNHYNRSIVESAGYIAVYTFDLSHDVMTDIVVLHCNPYCCMTHRVKRLFDIYEDMVEVLLVVCVFLTKDSQIEYMFTGGSPCSESCLFLAVTQLQISFI